MSRIECASNEPGCTSKGFQLLSDFFSILKVLEWNSNVVRFPIGPRMSLDVIQNTAESHIQEYKIIKNVLSAHVISRAHSTSV